MMEQTGMTDRQFDGFIRFILNDLKELSEEPDEVKKKKKLEKMIDTLQKILEH